MKSLWLKLVVALFTVAALAGCATDLKISGVSISVVDLRPVNATLFETEARLTLRFANESVVPIAVSGSSHKLYLNDTYVGRAVDQDAVGMPSMNTATHTVTLYIENLALLQRLQGLDRSSTVSYRLESVLRIDAGEQYDNVKIRSSGSVDLSALLPAAQR